MGKCIEIKSPFKIEKKKGYKTIFLAGSIEMGNASNWQEEIVEGLEDEQIIFYNPRRDDWDSSWEQTIDNPEFRNQVEWELNGLKESDYIIMYFDPKTKSPITLLELGLFATSKKIVLCCPKGYWRKGNVDIVCKQYGITMVHTIEDIVKHFKGE